MSYKIQSSFAAGELDPALHERTTFDKYKAGLATLRNATIGKTGRIVSRAGTKFYKATKFANKKCVLYSPPFTKYLLEWGDLYVRIHDTDDGTYTEVAHALVEADLETINFQVSGDYIYVFSGDGVFGSANARDNLKLNFVTGTFIPNVLMFETPIPPSETSRSLTGTGFPVEYAVTQIIEEEESVSGSLTVGTGRQPVTPGEVNTFVLSCHPNAKSIRMYRRPVSGIAFGFVGETPVIAGVATFSDYGSEADYTQLPPDWVLHSNNSSDQNKTGLIYQQRLLVVDMFNTEVILATRTGFQNNFMRNFPYTDDSALVFKAGTSGNAKILKMIDSNGLIVFTTAGIFSNQGALTPQNISLKKEGSWIINEHLPPLEIPGSIIFLDKSTNTVRNLTFSQEATGILGNEISIFSSHLFSNRQVKSWTFQDGDTPLIWIVFEDGGMVSLTYQQEHEMRAWSRHDTDGSFESTTTQRSLSGISTSYFVINRDGGRFIESTTPRLFSDLKDFIGMDSAVTFKSELSNGGTVTITVTPVTPGVWDGPLTIASSSPVFANSAGNGAINTIFRFFDADKTNVDLTVIAFNSSSSVTVDPSVIFPSDEASSIKLYKTYINLTGLTHLEGKAVSIMSDGYVVASPNNDVDSYATYTVTGGAITLLEEDRGAIIHVGLPFTSDIETLDIDTVEQKPTLLESRLVNKVFLKVYNSRGLFAGSEFPADDKVTELEDIEDHDENEDLGNSAKQPVTKRISFPIPNSWDSNGRVCLRQVDPLPFEILSIIPDLTVLYS